MSRSIADLRESKLLLYLTVVRMTAETATPSPDIAASYAQFELNLFSAREAYVYHAPPAGTVSIFSRGFY